MDNTIEFVSEDDICQKCNKNNEEGLIFCERCLKWFHHSCVNITESEYQKLSTETDDWFCPTCENGDTPLTIIHLSCELCIDTPQESKTYKGIRGLTQHGRLSHKDSKEFEKFIKELKTHGKPQISLEEKLAILKKNTPVLKRIPKGARIAAATKMTALINDCVKKNDVQSWERLLTFSFVAFRVPEKKLKSLTSEVKKNIINFDVSQMTLQTKDRSNVENRIYKVIESKVAQGDIRGAVKLLASSDELAPTSDETFEQLKRKHPSPTRVLQFPPSPDTIQENLTTTTSEVQKAITSFPNGSSSGIDGILPQHHKDLTSKVTGNSDREQ